MAPDFLPRSCVPDSLSVVMPVYNEQECIRKVVTSHADFLRTLGLEAWEIICVDDASTDSTPDILRELRESLPQLVILRHSTNRGIYESFQDGFVHSRYPLIFETGSDGQWPVENLAPMLQQWREGADLVVGVRSNRRQVYMPVRRIISYAFNQLSKSVFGFSVRDAGSVKLGRRETFCTPLIAKSVASAAERIGKANRDGHKIAFVPITFSNRGSGRATGASISNIGRSLIELTCCFFYYRLGIGRPRPRGACVPPAFQGADGD